jgi:hypothetical protein
LPHAGHALRLWGIPFSRAAKAYRRIAHSLRAPHATERGRALRPPRGCARSARS